MIHKKNKTLLSFLFLAGVSLIVFLYNIGYPRLPIFDEVYFIPAADRYIHRVFFQEPHPPVGKLIIALGQVITGNNGLPKNYYLQEKLSSFPDMNFWGYRLFPAIFGAGSVLLLFILINKLTKNGYLAFVCSLMLSLDNAFLAHSRAAHIDSTLIFFIISGLLLNINLEKDKNKSTWLLGIVNGLSIMTKLTGLVSVIPTLLVLLFSIRRLRPLLIWIFTMVVTMSVVWVTHYWIANNLYMNRYDASESTISWLQKTKGFSPTVFLNMIIDAYRYSMDYQKTVPELNLCKHDELGSPWYSWPFGGRSMEYRWERDSSITTRHLLLIPNLVVWITSLLGVLLSTSKLVSSVFGFVDRKRRTINLEKVFTITYWAYLMSFIPIRRVMYLYHYFPAMILGLVLFSINLSEMKNFFGLNLSVKNKKIILLLLAALTVGFFCFTMPVTYYLPISEKYFKWIAWFSIMGYR